MRPSFRSPPVRSQRGAVLVMGALMLVMMIGFLGLAIDSGQLFSVRRSAQSAADAAALAAAHEIAKDSATTASTSTALYASKTNGFENGVDGAAVTVQRETSTGTPSATGTHVRVTVTQDKPTFFMGVFGTTTSTVSAQAVASVTAGSTSSAACLHVRGNDNATASAVYVASGGRIRATCTAHVNSTSSSAISIPASNSGFEVTATSIGVRATTHNSINTKLSTPLQVNAGNKTDPFASLPVPNQTTDALGFNPDASCTTENIPAKIFKTGKVSSNRTWSPGLYCTGIWIDGGTHTFSPGYYVIRGGNSNSNSIEITNGSVSGTGVVFYITGTSGSDVRKMFINTSSSVSLSAPTTGRHAGVLFFQNPTLVPSSTLWHTLDSNANLTLNGAIYFKHGGFKMLSNAQINSSSQYTPIVVNQLHVETSFVSTSFYALNINSNYPATLPPTYPFLSAPPTVSLVD